MILYMFSVLPTLPPRISGLSSLPVLPGDWLHINCTSEKSTPPARLVWIVNGKEVKTLRTRIRFTFFPNSSSILILLSYHYWPVCDSMSRINREVSKKLKRNYQSWHIIFMFPLFLYMVFRKNTLWYHKPVTMMTSSFLLAFFVKSLSYVFKWVLNDPVTIPVKYVFTKTVNLISATIVFWILSFRPKITCYANFPSCAMTMASPASLWDFSSGSMKSISCLASWPLTARLASRASTTERREFLRSANMPWLTRCSRRGQTPIEKVVLKSMET